MEATKVQIDKKRLTPCGYCRRCSLHDDPGGCIEVYHYEIELLASGVTPREILMVSLLDSEGCLPETFEEIVSTFEADASTWLYDPIPGVTPGH